MTMVKYENKPLFLFFLFIYSEQLILKQIHTFATVFAATLLGWC